MRLAKVAPSPHCVPACVFANFESIRASLLRKPEGGNIMRRFASYIVIVAASWALAGCGGTPGGSSVAPVTSQNAVNAATRARIASLVHGKVKHVFVLIQENHTFDQLFGLFPGVNGQYVENLGTYLAQETDCQYDPETLGCQRPFLISPNSNSPNYVADAPDITGGNNGRYDQEVSIDRGKMDDFLVDAEAGLCEHLSSGGHWGVQHQCWRIAHVRHCDDLAARLQAMLFGVARRRQQDCC